MEAEIIKAVRKNCNLCYARRGLRSSEKEMEIARKALKDLYYFYIDKFNQLRGTDAPSEAVLNAKDSKNLCLNLIDECKSCDRSIDKLNQGLREISK